MQLKHLNTTELVPLLFNITFVPLFDDMENVEVRNSFTPTV